MQNFLSENEIKLPRTPCSGIANFPFACFVFVDEEEKNPNFFSFHVKKMFGVKMWLLNVQRATVFVIGH